MAKFIELVRPTITTHSGEVLGVNDDRVLCTDNVYTYKNVLLIMIENDICPDVQQADWIISQLPVYYTAEDVVRIDALI